MTLTRWLSRRDPRYIRSLVYMLQASEYDIAHFWRWHERTNDFSAVEKRKKLVFTPKAIALLAIGWLTVPLVIFLSGIAITHHVFPWNYVVALILILELPLFVLFDILVTLALLRLIQAPVEYVLKSRAKQTLASHKAVKIAIAGSFGKTSMREILKTVLSEGKKLAAPGGSQNTPLGIAKFVSTLKGDEDVLIFELGEYYPGDVSKLCKIVRPTIGIITGVNEAHLEKFKTLERTAATIFELADYLNGETVYVNGENDISRGEARESHVLYSREGAASWKVSNPHTGLDGTSFVLTRGDVRIEAHSKLLGLHHIGPLAAAADIASRLGLAPQEVQAGISKTHAFDHRLEPETEGAGVTTLDDSYNGNPDGVKAVIEFLATLKGRRIYVTPGLVEMGARKEEVHKEIGRQLAQAGIEKVILIRNSVTPFIERGLKESGYKGELIWFDEGLAAYKALPQMTVKGDIVLLQNDWPDQYF
ncbi:UDP-N-acetylmuramoyl-tripeptide--D-alanyl-D-alanine ligase [Candidatus Kaiserbacteria bacterium]|nr:UDP-N-acetylmuramoyl-tripeptide--D-alanyl-D-alanine ligase [Candidatus Kaiserbacteria bacterium]